MEITDVPENETDESVLHTLELIRRWHNVLAMHQNAPEPSELAIAQYTDLIAELTTKLAELIEARYGLTLELKPAKPKQAA